MVKDGGDNPLGYINVAWSSCCSASKRDSLQHSMLKVEVLANAFKDGLLGTSEEIIAPSATINWMGLSKPKADKKVAMVIGLSKYTEAAAACLAICKAQGLGYLCELGLR